MGKAAHEVHSSVIVIDAREGIEASDLSIITNNEATMMQLKFVLINSSDPYAPERIITQRSEDLVLRVCEHLRVSEIIYYIVREIPARVHAISSALDTPNIEYQKAVQALREIAAIAWEAQISLSRSPPAHVPRPNDSEAEKQNV